MTKQNVDYEALEAAAYYAYIGAGRSGKLHPYEKCDEPQKAAFRVEIRAVLAALPDQGLRVVRTDDLYQLLYNHDRIKGDVRRRLMAALESDAIKTPEERIHPHSPECHNADNG